jgi:uncharacterized protein YjbI with pentapeptide repeats
VLIGLCLLCSRPAAAQILTTGDTVIPGTQGITVGPGIDLSGWNSPGHELEMANLAGVDLSNATFVNSDITAGALSNSNLTSANFANSNLSNATFSWSTLTGADLTGAIITGAAFEYTTGLTAAQLYSTASYASGNLSGLVWNSDVMNGNFAGFILTKVYFQGASANANFVNANLTDAILGDVSGANFTGARLTGARIQTSVAGANFTGATINGVSFFNFYGTAAIGLTATQLYSTSSYINRDLTGVAFGDSDLTGFNFSNQNLTNADLTKTTIQNADFTGAVIQGAAFFGGVKGITASQLYSTASYASHNLSGIELLGGDFTGWNFSKQNLTYAPLDGTYTNADFSGAILEHANLQGTFTNANFANANLTGASFHGEDFTGADFRGTTGFPNPSLVPNLTNVILPDGTIRNLSIVYNQVLVIRDNLTAITVNSSASIGGTLQFLLDDRWTSSVGFSGLPQLYPGHLDLELADGVDPETILGETFQLFRWSVLPVMRQNQFASITEEPGLVFDLSNLYTIGTVRLVAVPEPSSFALLSLASLLLFIRRRRLCPGQPPGATGATAGRAPSDVADGRSSAASALGLH